MPHKQHWQTSIRSDTSPDVVEPLALLIGVLAAAVLALPAFVMGLLLARVTSDRSWSLLLWLGLAVCGFGLTVFLAFHGLEALLVAQLVEMVHAARLHQANLLQWDWSRLWAYTWPVWLHTLPLVPVVALWRTLASQFHRGGAAALQQQERMRQQAVGRAQQKAARRLRRLHHVPDAVKGHMVIGIPIEDEDNA
jgi:hypothetical protein